MTLSTLTLGSIDLLDVTKYTATANASGWHPKYSDEEVPLRASDGAVTSYRREEQTVREVGLVIRGTVQVNRAAIDSILQIACQVQRSATPVTYVENYSYYTSPDTWKVVGGRFEPLDDQGRIFGQQKGILRLVLSKN